MGRPAAGLRDHGGKPRCREAGGFRLQSGGDDPYHRHRDIRTRQIDAVGLDPQPRKPADDAFECGLRVPCIERDSFAAAGSRLQQGFRGHLIKSRARASSIVYNLLVDGVGGSASYELEFPNGGLAWVVGNIIGQSPTTDNRDLISYGAEGPRWPDNALYLAHNTLVDERLGGRFLRVWTDRMPAGTEVWAINNLLVGHTEFSPQAPGRYAGNQPVDRSALVDADGLDFRLPGNSPLRGKAMAPGSVRERSLTPAAEFRLPAGTRPLVVGKPLSAGALQ